MTPLIVIALLLLGLFPVLAALSGVVQDPMAFFSVLKDPRIHILLMRTIALGVATACCAGLIGVPVGRLLARTQGALTTFLALLLPLPLVLPPWILGIAWSRLVPLSGFWGATFLLTASLWPLVALFALRGFSQAGSAFESARLARGGFAGFWRVELPLARPSITGGLLLVFLLAVADFAVVDLLTFTSSDPFVVLSNEIKQKWGRPDRDVQAAAVSLMAMAPGLIALAGLLRLERRDRADHRATFDGGGVMRSLGTAGSLGAVLAVGFMVVPLAVLGDWARGHPDPLSTVLDPDVGRAALRSVEVGLGVGLIVAVLGTATAALSLRLSRRGEWWLLLLALLPLASPAVMFGVGEIRLWNLEFLPWGREVYLSPLLLVLAGAGRFLPLGVLAARAWMMRQNPVPGEVARLAGRSVWTRRLRVDAPALGPALGLSFAAGYLLSLRELDLVTVIPAGSGTLAHLIFGMVHISRDHLTAVLCLLALGLVLIPAIAVRLLGTPGVIAGTEEEDHNPPV